MRKELRADELFDVAPQVYPTGTKFFVSTGEISFKSACQQCGYSLYWCKCDPPIVLGKEVIVSTKQ